MSLILTIIFPKKNLTIIIKLAYIYRYDMYERTILTRLPSKTDLLTVNAVTPPLLLSCCSYGDEPAEEGKQIRDQIRTQADQNH